MNIIRFLFFIFLLAAAFAVVGVFLMFTPTGQTWVVQSRLDRPQGLHGNVGSFWAFFGKLQIDDLRLERDGYVLTAPHIEARLPVIRALLWRNLTVRNLTAKGWTLDLSRIPDPNTGAPPNDSAETPATIEAQKKTEFVFRGVLDAWRLPAQLSLDHAELEGDVLVGAGPGEKPNKVHVIVSGGGMRVGAEGKFQIMANTSMLDLQREPMFVEGSGELRATPRENRTWEQLALSGEVDLKGGSFPDRLELTGSAQAMRQKNGGEIYALSLSRNGRSVLSAQLAYANGQHQLSGDWKLHWQHEDSALLWAGHPWPSLAAQGAGRIEIADTLRSAHVLGAAQTETKDLGKWYAPLQHFAGVSLEVTFDATEAGSSLHAEQLKLAFAGANPALSAQLVGPIDVDWLTGTWAPTRTGQSDLAQLAVNRYQLKWLSGLLGDWRFAQGEVSGNVWLKASKDQLSFHSAAPLEAKQIVFLRSENVVADHVDGAVSLSGEYTPDAWKIQYSPVTISRDGKTLLTFSVSREKTAADKPVQVEANWKADLAASQRTSAPAAAAADPMPLRSVEGNFSGRVDPTLRGEGAANFVGTGADQTLNVQYGMSLGENDTVTLRAPISMVWGKRKSEIVVDGNYAHTREGHGLDATISGSTVHLDQLGWLTTHVANLARLDGSPAVPDEAATRQPFWQDWFGNFTVNINELETGGSVFKEVGGVLSLTNEGLKLNYGHYVGADLLNVPIKGELTFNADRAEPYEASGSIGVRHFDAKPFFPAPKPDHDPVFEGKFAIETTFSSRGKDWPELLAHAQKQYHLTSTSGIVRLLKVDVADAIPQPGSVVSDSATSVGNAVGKVFGRRGFGSGEIKLPRHTQAVIDFTLDTSEILYKEIEITATQGADENIHVNHIEMQGDDEHLVGKGDLTYVAGKPMAEWPLRFDFKFGARGKLIDSLAAAHLLSGEKDSAGYDLINGDAKFAGTIQNLDTRPWHDFLAAAATAKMADEKDAATKKNAAAATSKK